MDEERNTNILSNDDPLLRRALKQQVEVPVGTASLGDNREVLLMIRGMIERLVVSENEVYQLGRFDGIINNYQVDLSPYGAEQRGVSRLHAQIHMKSGQLYITDLGSTNGTYLGGKRLEPKRPSVLHKGDELLLGRLALQFLFR